MTWDPVYTSPTDTLTAYHVVYKDASGKAYMKKIGSRKSTAQLTSLEKFSTYTVTVTAMTDGGLGETSSAVKVTTMEDGEFFLFYVFFAFVSKPFALNRNDRCDTFDEEKSVLQVERKIISTLTEPVSLHRHWALTLSHRSFSMILS